jgi:hypothetical protein
MSIISNSKTVLNERIYWEPRLWADNVFILLLIIKKCKSSSLLRRAGENIPQIQAKTEAKIWSQQLHPFNGYAGHVVGRRVVWSQILTSC